MVEINLDKLPEQVKKMLPEGTLKDLEEATKPLKEQGVTGLKIKMENVPFWIRVF